MVLNRIAGWLALQYDTYRVAREENISFWELRRVRKVVKHLVELGL